MNVPRGWRLLLPFVILALIIAFPRLLEQNRSAPRVAEPPAARETAAEGDRAIEEAFRLERSGVWVSSSGTVEKILADDREGDRHQRFVVRLESGITLLFAHNVDLAPRVPVREGDAIRFRGRYEWNDRGGVIHWTHDDRRGGGPGGWIEHGGRTYR